MSSNRRKLRRDALVGAAFAALVGLVFLLTPLGHGLTGISYELPFLIRHDIIPEGVAIVYMDWDSHVRLEQQEFRRWDRKVHARLLDRLRAMHAKAVVFDIVFLSTTDSAAADRELVRAVREHGKVAVGALVSPDVQQGEIAGWKLTKPFPELESAARWGVVEVGDEDRRVRQHYFRRDYDAPSLAWRAAELTKADNLPDPFQARWVNYYGPQGIVPHFSYWEVLATNAIPANTFSNKVVFVGAQYDIGMTGGKGTDDFRTPYTRTTGRRSPGVEITATTYLNLIRGDWLNRLSPFKEAALVVVAGALFGLGFCFCRPIPAAGLALLCFGVVASTGYFGATRLIWFPWMILAAVQIPCAFGWSVVAFAAHAGPRNRSVEKPIDGIRREPAQTTAASTLRGPAIELARPTPGAIDLAQAAVKNMTAVTAQEGRPEIPEYELLRLIGSGAYGDVWLARNVIGTYNAVKIVHRRNFRDDQPYDREFAGLRKFTPISRAHPGFVHILHVGRKDELGYIYYVMEVADDVVSGQKIDVDVYSPRNLASDLERRKRLPVGESIQLGMDLALALDSLHGHGLIHRDIKPANIIFVKGAAKLADIGLVTDVAKEGRPVTYLGTWPYIPPEGPGSAGADVYSLGKVLYQASTGLDVKFFPEIPMAFVSDPNEAAFFELNKIIVKACEIEPKRRFASATEIHDALAKLQHQLHLQPRPKP